MDLNNAGDAAGCLARLGEAPPFDDPEVGLRLAVLAHACAAAAADLGAAEAWIEPAGGAAGVDPVARLNHAALLQRDGRDDAALALLTAVGPPGDDAGLAQDFRSLEVDIRTRAGELDAAMAVLGRGPVDPVARINVGVLLANEQRVDEAILLVRTACSELDPGAQRESCEALLGQLEGL